MSRDAAFFYWPPDGQARQPCAWGHCEKPQEPGISVNLCGMHARLVYRILDEDRRVLGVATPEDFTEPIEQFAAEALDLGWIYYLAVGDRIKVGYTKDLKKRLNHYPPDSELLAMKPGTKKQERTEHSLLTAHRVAGREWYTRHLEVLERAAAVVAEYGPPVVKHEWTKPSHARTQRMKFHSPGVGKIA